VILDGLPAGIKIRTPEIRKALRRRRPGFSILTSARAEADEPEILAGTLRGSTTGAPLAIIIRNRDARPQDYARLRHLARPGHADLGAWLRFGEWYDWRGGGHFSGRMTAPLVAASAVAMMTPWMKGIKIAAHAVQIGKMFLRDSVRRRLQEQLSNLPLRVLSGIRRAVLCSAIGCIERETEQAMVAEIRDAAAKGNSVGGVIECIVVGAPAGLGSPPFDGVEPAIARLILAIPAAKGIEFGAGFAGARMFGSEHNDPIVWSQDTRTPGGYRSHADLPQLSAAMSAHGSKGRRQEAVSTTCGSDGRHAESGDTTACAAAGVVVPKTLTNNAGGVLGGITTGMPIVFRVAFKPTPSIAVPQQTVDLRAARVIERTGRIPEWATKRLRLKGRHDPCVVPRAIAVVEACAALAVANLAPSP
jgi:chorismate synthase